MRLHEEVFVKCEDISIDYDIMEHTNIAAVFLMDFAWSDEGDLAALKQANPEDNNGNMICDDVQTFETKNCLIHYSHKLVSTLVVDNLAIVDTKGALLYCES